MQALHTSRRGFGDEHGILLTHSLVLAIAHSCALDSPLSVVCAVAHKWRVRYMAYLECAQMAFATTMCPRQVTDGLRHLVDKWERVGRE